MANDETIGSVRVGIRGDYSQLGPDFDAAVSLAVQKGATLHEAIEASLKSFDSSPLVAAMNAVGEASTKTAGLIIDLEGTLKNMGAAGQQFSGAAQDIIAKQNELNTAVETSRGALAELKTAFDQGQVSAETVARAEDDLTAALKAAKLPAEEAAGALQKIADGSGSLMIAGAGITAAVTVPIVGMATAAFEAAKDYDEAFDKIRAATGATGDQLTGLETSFRNVFLNVPASAKDVADAMALVEQKTALAGKPLEDLTTQFLNLAHITGEAAQPMIVAVTRAFGDWSIATGNQSHAMDELMRASQATGVPVTQLTDLVVKFGAPMRELGFNFEQATAIMGSFQREGVNLQTALSGMRFALGNFVAAGKEPVQAFQDIVDKIRNTTDATAALDESFHTFGRRAAADMFDVIKGGRLDIAALFDTIANGKDTVNQAAEDTRSFAEKWRLFKNNLEDALVPLGTGLVGAAESALAATKPVLELIRDSAEWFAALPQPIQLTVEGVAALAAAVGPLVVALGGMGFAIQGLTGALPVVTGLMEAMGLKAGAAAIAQGEAAAATTAMGEASGIAQVGLSGMAGVIGIALVSALAAATLGFHDLNAAMVTLHKEEADTNTAFQEYLLNMATAPKTLQDVADAHASIQKALDSGATSAANAEKLFALLDQTQQKVEKSANNFKDASSALGITLDMSLTKTDNATKSMSLQQAQTEATRISMENLRDTLDSANQKLVDTVKAFDAGKASATDVAKAQDAVAAATKQLQQNYDALAPSVTQVHGATKAFIDTSVIGVDEERLAADATAGHSAKIESLVQSLYLAQKNLQIANDEYDAGNISLKQLATAQDAVVTVQNKLNKAVGDMPKIGNIITPQDRQALEDLNGDMSALLGAVTHLPEPMSAVNTAMANLTKGSDMMGSSIKGISPDIDGLLASLKVLERDGDTSWDEVNGRVKILEDGIKGLATTDFPAFVSAYEGITDSLIKSGAPHSMVVTALGQEQGYIQKLAKEDLPGAAAAQADYIAQLIATQAPLKAIQDATEAWDKMQIQLAQDQGTSTTDYIRQLVAIEQQQTAAKDGLVLYKQGFDTFGGAVNDVMKTADTLGMQLFSNIGVGLTQITQKGETFHIFMMQKLHELEGEIVNIFVGVALKAMFDALVHGTNLIDDLGKAFKGVIDGITKTTSSLASSAPDLAKAAGLAASATGVLSSSASGLSDAALGTTSRLSQLSGQLNPLSGMVDQGTKSISDMGSSATKAASGIASGAGSLMSTFSGIGSAVSAVTGVIGVFQAAAAEATNKLIEQNTRISAIVESKELPLANAISVEQEATFHDISTFTSVLPDISLHTSVLPDAMKNLIAALGNWDVLFSKLDGLYTAITGIKVTLGGTTSSSSSGTTKTTTTTETDKPIPASDATISDNIQDIRTSGARTSESTTQHLAVGRDILGLTNTVAQTSTTAAQKASDDAQKLLQQAQSDSRTAQQKADDLHDQFLHAQEIAQAGYGQNKAWNDQALSLYNQWLAAQKVADDSVQQVLVATDAAAKAQQAAADAAAKAATDAAKAAATAADQGRTAEQTKAQQAADLQARIDKLQKEIADDTVQMNEASKLQEDDLAQGFKDAIGADTDEVKRLQTKLDTLQGTSDRTAKSVDGLQDTVVTTGRDSSKSTSDAIAAEINGLKDAQGQMEKLSEAAMAAGNQSLALSYKAQADALGAQIVQLQTITTDGNRALKTIQGTVGTVADDGGKTATNTGRTADDTQHMRVPIDQTAQSTAGTKDDTAVIRQSSTTTAANTGRGADAAVGLKDDTTHLRTAGDQTAQNTSRGADNTKTVADTTQKVVDASDIQVKLLTDAGDTLATIEEGTHHLDDILSVLTDLQTPIGAIRIDLDAMFPIVQASLDKGGILDLGLTGILDAVTPETGLLTKILGAFADLMTGIDKANKDLTDTIKSTNSDFLTLLKQELDDVVKALKFEDLMALLKKQYDDRIKYDEDKYDVWTKFWNTNLTNLRTNLSSIETAVNGSTKALQGVLITMNTSLSSISTAAVSTNSWLSQIHADSGAVINELSAGVTNGIVSAVNNTAGNIMLSINAAADSIGAAISGAISSVGSMVTSAVGAIAAAVSAISVNVTVNVTTPAADSGDGGSSSASSSMAAAPNPPRELLGRGVLMMPDIRSIATNPASALAYRQGPTGAGSMNQNITFNVNGAQNPRDTVNAIAAYLKTVSRNQAILGS